MKNDVAGFRNLLVSIFLLAIFIFAATTTGFASLSGSWQNDLYLKPQTESLVAFESELFLEYSSGGITYSSISSFETESYSAQKFGVDFSLGVFGFDSTLSFYPPEQRLNYFLTEARTSISGLDVVNTFLLEYAADDQGFGSGYELQLSGELPGGPKMYITNLFGMEKNEAEALGIVSGSGYNIWTGSAGNNYGPSQLQYVSTTVEISQMSFDCCDYLSTTKFSEEKGFEYSTFEFDLESENLPLELRAKLSFSSQTKSVELDPRIDLDWACFEVYTDLATPDDEDLLGNNSTKVSTIGALEIEGLGITGVELGHVTFSSLTALKGNLNKLYGDEDIDLRADDYVLDPDPVYIGLYTETSYDEVISIERSNEVDELYFGADIYFDMSGSSSLFDTALFTGQGEYELSDQFTLSGGAAIKPDSLEKFRLGFDYYF